MYAREEADPGNAGRITDPLGCIVGYAPSACRSGQMRSQGAGVLKRYSDQTRFEPFGSKSWEHQELLTGFVVSAPMRIMLSQLQALGCVE
jgi:hypothetical protein